MDLSKKPVTLVREGFPYALLFVTMSPAIVLISMKPEVFASTDLGSMRRGDPVDFGLSLEDDGRLMYADIVAEFSHAHPVVGTVAITMILRGPVNWKEIRKV